MTEWWQLTLVILGSCAIVCLFAWCVDSFINRPTKEFLEDNKMKNLALDHGLPWYDDERIIWPKIELPEEKKQEPIKVKPQPALTAAYSIPPPVFGWQPECGHTPACEYTVVNKWEHDAEIYLFHCGKRAWVPRARQIEAFEHG